MHVQCAFGTGLRLWNQLLVAVTGRLAACAPLIARSIIEVMFYPLFYVLNIE
jgi:hypothetical protein